MDEFIAIGHTQKPHALTGELKVFVEEAYLEDFLQAPMVFLDLKGQKLPFFVEQVRGEGAMIVAFEDINSREDAEKISKKELFIRQQDLIPDTERQLPVKDLEYSDYIGFQIQDTQLGAVGVIEDIAELPQQEMAVVQYKEKEILIPLNQTWIVEVLEQQRIVLMDLPEGLLDL
ncbi:MAG: 16S rRNA processing protein RimM [Saprospiraceae bacterium]|nr:16S rRNA processing protein RimM [Saprospiraceae bacterium]